MKILQKLIPKKELILADKVMGTMLIINGLTYQSGRLEAQVTLVGIAGVFYHQCNLFYHLLRTSVPLFAR